MTNEIRIDTLGGLQVWLNGRQAADFDTDKARALLVYLAIEKDRPQPRERLAGLLWSDQPAERALHSLRQALSSLRRVFAGCEPPAGEPLILAARDALQLNPAARLRVDLAEFEQRLQAAYRYYRRGSAAGRINARRLSQAVELAHGPFLDQLKLSGSPLFDEWLLLRREAVEQQMCEALGHLAEIYERRGDLRQALQAAERLARLAPWDEAACCRVMRLYGADGQWSAAQAYGRRFARYLAGELGVTPSAELLGLLEQARRAGRAQASGAGSSAPASGAPAGAASGAVGGLPAAHTPFVGRSADLDALADLLCAPHCRLVSLVGMGGIGKTRLALQAAAEQAGLLRDGVFFVPLAGAAGPADCTAAIAEALGFHFFGDRPPTGQLGTYLAGKELLLVLDNFEQLVGDPAGGQDAVGLLLDLLSAAPGLQMLLTSRLPLRLRLETVYEVGGLDCPPEGAAPAEAASGALALFAQTARRACPGWRLAHDGPAAAAICRLLEGAPLAIELAASWAGERSCAEVLVDLQADLLRLSSGMRDAPDRHRSLRAVLEQTWRQLPEAEREVFRRLAVFPGSFSRAAAAAVAPGGARVEQALESLAQKSLLQRFAPGRYALHGLVRRFAAEQLAGQPAAAGAAAARHAAWCFDLLAARLPALKGAGQQQALAELALEQPNWRQAWERLAAEPAGRPALAHGCEAVFHFYSIRGEFLEGIPLFQQAVAQLEQARGAMTADATGTGGADEAQAAEAGSQAAGLLGRLLAFLGALAYRAHQDELCQESLARALPLLEAAQDRAGLGLGLVFWAGIQARRKAHAPAIQAVQRSLAIFRELGDAWGQSYALYLQGLLLNRRGDFPAADAALRAGLAAARACGDLHRQVSPLSLLGDSACQAGEYARAEGYFQEGLAISRRLHDRYNEALVSLNLGTVYHLRGELEAARRLYRGSLEICRDIGDDSGQAVALSNLGELAGDCGNHQAALSLFLDGLALARTQHDAWAEISCLNNLAGACLELDDLPAAAGHINAALDGLRGLDAGPLAAITLLQLARLELRRGQSKAAARLLGLVLHTAGTEQDIRQKARRVCEQAGLPQGELPLGDSLEALLPGLRA
ncbi:MAG: AfsR/SARP family transcriptional regulator [Chloroflexota bacterium]